MKRFFDNFIMFIITILIIGISALTIFFTLDVFGVIIVPPKYSLASRLYTQVDILAAGYGEVDETVKPTDKVKKPTNKVFANTSVESQYPDDYAQQVLDQMNTETSEIPAIDPVEVVSVNRYYYSQLDSHGKKIYDELHKNIDGLKSGEIVIDFGLEFDDLLHTETGEVVLHNSFQLAVNALTFDNPELFYLNVTKIYLLTETTTRAFSKTYRVKVGANEEAFLAEGFIDKVQVENTIKTLDGIKDQIVAACKDKTTVDQIRIVHDYLVDTIEYDSTAGNNIYNIYGALVSKRAVCEGYARTFKYVLDDLGIPCIIACGIGQNSAGETEAHAWNYVQINGAWYAIDVTWDDPIITGGGRVTDTIKYAYFLKGSDEFFKDHFEDGNIVDGASFKYPTINKVNY